MNEPLYATKQMVTSFHSQYVKETGKYPRLPETLLLMKEQDLLSKTPLPVPDIHSQMSLQEFRKAYEQIPFEANRIIYGEPNERNIVENSIFPKDRDVFCVQHFHNFGAGELQVDNFYTITCIFEGTCRLICGDNTIELVTGDICIIAPGSYYFIEAQAGAFAYEAIIRASSFNLMFGDLITVNSTLSDYFRDAQTQAENYNYLLIRAGGHDEELRRYLQEYTAECINEDEYANICAVSLLKLFLNRSFRKYKDSVLTYKEEGISSRPDSKAIMQFIRNNYLNITLDKVATHFHYNKTYLSRLIHLYYNKTFIQIITELKISQAKQYLRNSSHRISDIAFLTGYDNVDHFSRTFKKETGLAPAFYRRKYNEEQRL